jgi:hypothetical protein
MFPELVETLALPLVEFVLQVLGGQVDINYLIAFKLH